MAIFAHTLIHIPVSPQPNKQNGISSGQIRVRLIKFSAMPGVAEMYPGAYVGTTRSRGSTHRTLPGV
jgi:hypothetical protein